MPDTPPMGQLLWAVIVILVVLWLVGLLLHILGAFIHILLVLAVIVLIVQLVSRGRNAT